MWLSLVERYVRDVEVAGSNPVTPMKKRILGILFFYAQLAERKLFASQYRSRAQIARMRNLNKGSSPACAIFLQDNKLYGIIYGKAVYREGTDND